MDDMFSDIKKTKYMRIEIAAIREYMRYAAPDTRWMAMTIYIC